METTSDGSEYKWFVPQWNDGHDKYGQLVYNYISTTTEVSVSSLIQALSDRIEFLEGELNLQKEKQAEQFRLFMEEVEEKIRQFKITYNIY